MPFVDSHHYYYYTLLLSFLICISYVRPVTIFFLQISPKEPKRLDIPTLGGPSSVTVTPKSLPNL